MAYNIYHYSTILASFLIHLAIYQWFASWILRKVSPVFTTLGPDKQIVLRNCVMSIANAVAVASLGVYVFLYPGGATKDKLWFDCPPFRHSGCIGLGYVFADSLLMFFNTPLQDRMMVVHHVASIWGLYSGTVIPAIPYYGNLWAIMELSNPLVHIRMILKSLDLKNTRLYKLNGITLLVVFFACRIVPILLWFQLAPFVATGELYEVGPMLLIGIFGTNPAIYGLNIYWFSKICRGAYRVLFIPLLFQLAPLMTTKQICEVGTMALIIMFALTPIIYGLNTY